MERYKVAVVAELLLADPINVIADKNIHLVLAVAGVVLVLMLVLVLRAVAVLAVMEVLVLLEVLYLAALAAEMLLVMSIPHLLVVTEVSVLLIMERVLALWEMLILRGLLLETDMDHSINLLTNIQGI
jgi:hypothetical protein